MIDIEDALEKLTISRIHTLQQLLHFANARKSNVFRSLFFVLGTSLCYISNHIYYTNLARTKYLLSSTRRSTHPLITIHFINCTCHSSRIKKLRQPCVFHDALGRTYAKCNVLSPPLPRSTSLAARAKILLILAAL